MRSERGSATVEVAASIAALALFACVIFQLLLVMDAYLVAGHATREGARALAAGAPETKVRFLVASIAGIDPNEAEITIEPPFHVAGDVITVSLDAEVTRLAVLNDILPDLPVHASSSARAEMDHP